MGVVTALMFAAPGQVWSSGLNILNIDPRVLILQIGGFILLLLVFRRFLFGPISQMLETRRHEIAETYESAEQAKAAADELRKDYERRMAEIESEAHARIQAVVKEAQTARDEIMADSRTRSEAVLQRGLEELAREREKTIAAIRKEVVELVVAASSKLLERSMDIETHRKLIDDFISTVGKTN